MGDDERRAEIETVARAWWAYDPRAFDTLMSEWRALQMRRAEAAIAALDRVRDARRDEAPKIGSWRCPRCGKTAVTPDRHRCPQGEEHEAGHWVQPKAFCEQPRCQTKNDGHCHVPENCGHFQPRERWVPAPSPARAARSDTVAVEDVVAWLRHVDRLDEIPSAKRCMPTYNILWDAANAFEAQFPRPKADAP